MLTGVSYARIPASLQLGSKLFDIRKAIPISNSGGILMKQLLFVAAVVGLATTGCAQNGMLSRSGGGGHIIRSRQAPRPEIRQTAYRDSCCGVSSGCDGPSCGAGGCVTEGFASVVGEICNSCRGVGCGLCRGLRPHAGGYPEVNNFNPSPPTGQVAYPYYTTKGPRDFLLANPHSIGPN